MTRSTPHRLFGLDAVAEFRRMQVAERAQLAACGVAEVEGDRWQGRAKHYARASGRARQPDAYLEALLGSLRETDVVVDVGAGTGRHALFLCDRVARVIAVEPSPSMREQLQQRIAERSIRNVEVRAQAWPISDEARSAEGDVVLSAHVLYAVQDVEPFLEAMARAARREAVLFLRVRSPNVGTSPIFERLHGAPRLPMPGALEVLAVLHQLGFAATLEIVADARGFGWLDLDEMVEDMAARLRVPAARAAELRAACEACAVRRPDGTLTIPDDPIGAIVRFSG